MDTSFQYTTNPQPSAQRFAIEIGVSLTVIGHQHPFVCMFASSEFIMAHPPYRTGVETALGAPKLSRRHSKSRAASQSLRHKEYARPQSK